MSYFSANRFSAFLKYSMGARTSPAPTIGCPGSLCAMAVSMIGSVPVWTTFLMSMPIEVSSKPRGWDQVVGALPNRGLPHLTAEIGSLFRRSPDETENPVAPPSTNPPQPTVSVMAESPVSLPSPPCLYPGKYRPTTSGAGR